MQVRTVSAAGMCFANYVVPSAPSSVVHVGLAGRVGEEGRATSSLIRVSTDDGDGAGQTNEASGDAGHEDVGIRPAPRLRPACGRLPWQSRGCRGAVPARGSGRMDGGNALVGITLGGDGVGSPQAAGRVWPAGRDRRVRARPAALGCVRPWLAGGAPRGCGGKWGRRRACGRR